MWNKSVRCMICIGLTFFAAPAYSADQNSAITQSMAKIVEDREITSGYVLEVKRKFKPDDQVYEKARELYTTAMAKHNSWIAITKTAIGKGKTKNLGKDEQYQAIAGQADQASQAFVAYVQSAPGVTKSRGLAVAALAGLGLNMWSGFNEKRQKARDDEAERFERDARWKQWEDIRPEAA